MVKCQTPCPAFGAKPSLENATRRVWITDGSFARYCWLTLTDKRPALRSVVDRPQII